MSEVKSHDEFLLKEHSLLTGRIDILRKDIATFETLSMAAYLGSFSWLLAAEGNDDIKWLLNFLPALIALYALARIYWRVESIKLIEDYIRLIEADRCQLSDPERPQGYETYFKDRKGSRNGAYVREFLFMALALVGATYAFWVALSHFGFR